MSEAQLFLFEKHEVWRIYRWDIHETHSLSFFFLAGERGHCRASQHDGRGTTVPNYPPKLVDACSKSP